MVHIPICTCCPSTSTISTISVSFNSSVLFCGFQNCPFHSIMSCSIGGESGRYSCNDIPTGSFHTLYPWQSSIISPRWTIRLCRSRFFMALVICGTATSIGQLNHCASALIPPFHKYKLCFFIHSKALRSQYRFPLTTSYLV